MYDSDETGGYVDADQRLAEVARERSRGMLPSPRERGQAEQGHFSVAPSQRRSLDDPNDHEYVRDAALVEAAKLVSKAEAARVVDEWLRDGRLDRHTDGRVLCSVRCPLYAADFNDFGVTGHLASEWRTYDIVEGARLLLGSDNPEGEIRRRENQYAANQRAVARADQDAQKRHQQAIERRRKREERAEVWRNVGVNTGAPTLVRALLRNLDHPEHGAMFRVLAELALKEPHVVPHGQQPPDCALDLLGFDTSAVIDE